MLKTLIQAALVAAIAVSTAHAQYGAPASAPAAAPAPAAASPGIKRTILQRVEVPGTNVETILGMAEIAPGMNAGRHTHPGPETGTVTEGEMVLMVEGQPDRTLKVGDSYQIAAGTVHDVKTVSGAAKVVAVYMVPKGMALASPAK
jgi:quercetin dioxygenase-like cupin family protein